MLVIVLAFAAIAGLMAFLIQHEEMRRHLERRAALRAAAQAALVACSALVLLALVAARVLGLE